MKTSSKKPRTGSDPFHIIKSGVLYELRPAPEGGYTIIVPALPGCFSFGETVEQALTMIADAIEGFVAVSVEEGFPVPEHFLPDKSRPARQSPARNTKAAAR
jgi:predicted RNase H-like HicB family nuclease